MTNAQDLFHSRQALCPHCSHRAYFTRQMGAQLVPRWSETMPPATRGRSKTSPDWIHLSAVTCDGCDQVTFVLRAVQADDPAEYEILYPPEPPRTLEPGVPATVLDLFEEASTAEQAGAMRAAGVMYRAVAEAICAEQGASGHSLLEKIKSLKNLPSDIEDHLDQARILGNSSIHDAVAFSADEVSDVAELMIEVCVNLYTLPARRAGLKAARLTRAAAAKASPKP